MGPAYRDGAPLLVVAMDGPGSQHGDGKPKPVEDPDVARPAGAGLAEITTTDALDWFAAAV